MHGDSDAGAQPASDTIGRILRSTLLELEETQTRYDDLVTLISRDIRSPLTTLVGMLELIDRPDYIDLDDPTHAELVSRAASSARRCLDIVDRELAKAFDIGEERRSTA